MRHQTTRSCLLAGNLALGVAEGAVAGTKAARYTALAAKISLSPYFTCWLAGNLALGVAEGAVAGAKAARYTEVAANLTYTCWQMYARMPTGKRPASNPHLALSLPLMLCSGFQG